MDCLEPLRMEAILTKEDFFPSYSARWSCIQELNETASRKKNTVCMAIIKLGSFSVALDVRAFTLRVKNV